MTENGPIRLIIDTDPGVDDALAILMAASHPNARIEALTTVAGNVSLDRTTTNACAVLDVAGIDAPIGRHRSRCLAGPDVGLLGGDARAPAARRPAATR
ncbi:MAG: nucleoside hydrolase [Candidatus Limnocylindria bacterium]